MDKRAIKERIKNKITNISTNNPIVDSSVIYVLILLTINLDLLYNEIILL